MTTKLLICINIYTEKYYSTQLDSIKKYCLFDEITVIYNCCPNFNENLLKNYKSDNLNIIINPEKIRKRRFRGTIIQGIFSNFLYQKDYKYSQIVILTERSIFSNYLNNNICSDIFTNYNNNDFNYKYNYLTNKNECTNCEKIILEKWEWLKKYVIYNNFNQSMNLLKDKIVYSNNEGLLLDGYTFHKINEYLSNLDTIKLKNIYNSSWCIEEYLITQLCYNFDWNFSSLLKPTKSYKDEKFYNLKVEPMFNNYKCVIKIM